MSECMVYIHYLVHIVSHQPKPVAHESTLIIAHPAHAFVKTPPQHRDGTARKAIDASAHISHALCRRIKKTGYPAILIGGHIESFSSSINEVTAIIPSMSSGAFSYASTYFAKIPLTENSVDRSYDETPLTLHHFRQLVETVHGSWSGFHHKMKRAR